MNSPETAEYNGHPTGHVFDQARAEAAVRELLYAVGEDPDRHGLADTPASRVRTGRFSPGSTPIRIPC